MAFEPDRASRWQLLSRQQPHFHPGCRHGITFTFCAAICKYARLQYRIPFVLYWGSCLKFPVISLLPFVQLVPAVDLN